jgi:hypothetical protein
MSSKKIAHRRGFAHALGCVDGPVDNNARVEDVFRDAPKGTQHDRSTQARLASQTPLPKPVCGRRNRMNKPVSGLTHRLHKPVCGVADGSLWSVLVAGFAVGIKARSERGLGEGAGMGTRFASVSFQTRFSSVSSVGVRFIRSVSSVCISNRFIRLRQAFIRLRQAQCEVDSRGWLPAAGPKLERTGRKRVERPRKVIESNAFTG